MFVGFGIGATAYEGQIGRLGIRILRAKMYFWPYRHFLTGKLVFPNFIQIKIWPKEVSDE